MKKDKRYIKAMLAAFGVYTIWGFSFMASKIAQEQVTPFLLLAYRFDIAILILSVPIVLGKIKIKLSGKNIKPLLLLGTCEPCIYFIGEQYGLRFSNAAFSGVMIAIIPIVTLILATMFLKDRPSKAQWAFSLLSIAGIIVITLAESGGGSVSFLGFVFLCVAVLAGSAYGVISRKISDEFTVFERSYVMQIMGAVFYTVLALFEYRGDVAAMVKPLAGADTLLSILFLAVGASVLGYTLFNYAVSMAPMANVISLCNLTTVISVVSGVVLLSEPFSAVSAVAIVAVLVGIWGVQKFSPPETD